MDLLNEYGHNENSKFISQTKQIVYHTDLFRDANEDAISDNTLAMIEQTERLEAMISAQTLATKEQTNRLESMISAQTIANTLAMENHANKLEESINANTLAIKGQTDSLNTAISTQTDTISAQTNVQHEDAELARNNQTTLFGNLTKTIKKIFSKTNSDDEITNSFYDLVKSENDETQEVITANTNTIQSKISSVITTLQSVQNAITADTTADKASASAITSAIKDLQLIANVTIEDNRP